MPPPPSGPNPFDGRTLPSIFSVLPQQLGLKLESAQAPVEILVIDRAALSPHEPNPHKSCSKDVPLFGLCFSVAPV